MDFDILTELLPHNPQYRQLKDELHRKSTVELQLVECATSFTLSTLCRELKLPSLIITPRPEDARTVHEQLMAITGDEDSTVIFPEMETLPFERIVSDSEITHQRLSTLSNLVNYNKSQLIVVASTSAIIQKTLNQDIFLSSSHQIRVGDRLNMENILEKWHRMGYKMESSVYDPGSASRRGGIIDIFPIGNSLPARIEFWGDTVDSIRMFNPTTQRSVDVVDSILIHPANETLPALQKTDLLTQALLNVNMSNCTDETRKRIRNEFDLILNNHDMDEINFYSGFFNHGTLLDYFPDNSLVITINPSETEEMGADVLNRVAKLRKVKEQRRDLPIDFPSSYISWKEIEMQVRRFKHQLNVIHPAEPDKYPRKKLTTLPFRAPPKFLGHLKSFTDEIDELSAKNYIIIVVSSHSKRLADICNQSGLSTNEATTLTKIPRPGSITILQSDGIGLKEGIIFYAEDTPILILTDTEIFGFTKRRRYSKRLTSRRNKLLSQLSPNDYIVHIEHGIGKFLGTGRLEGDKKGSEYLIIQYSHGDKLYVPMDHLERISSYIGPMDRPPSLTRLGSQEWNRAKEKVERSTKEMASDLLSLYAERELIKGKAFSPDTVWQTEIENSFPFNETPDQKRTLEEVKSDMESSRPMDRLVCGDVGYGKTEIALRAAFKSVADGKQVAILVPTTVLAQQHYVTFSQRLSAYPVNVEVMSRFRTKKEQRSIVERLSKGDIDICIGTHRLIQRDVMFKELGLVVIDEEQRFGVKHKERLKQMRREVDVLTLTATPIPRTLHMAMAGVRDMSTMETPPEERLPIKTYISEFSDELIREAILRELDRQGQIYFLHNRVISIDHTAQHIRDIVPEASVAVVHGQMNEGQLEKVMLDFANGEIDVLVCTTIIESGLDIQNVNTLIVNRADNFGLSQLYQLRGRIGRSARRAYSYLLVPKSINITETAQKRLKAMMAATELGSGFHIAMRDLEIRGAGNILGSAQSGYIQAVGFHLYTQLLGNAVEELRARNTLDIKQIPVHNSSTMISDQIAKPNDTGKSELEFNQLNINDAVMVDLGIPYSLPSTYITELELRLEIYQRLTKLTGIEDVEDIGNELVDRFGPLPIPTQNLLTVMRLKLQSIQADIESITKDSAHIVITMSHDVGGAKHAIERRLTYPVKVGNRQIRLEVEKLPSEWIEIVEVSVNELVDFRRQLVEYSHI